MTHLLKLPDKMCKYETDPVSIVEDTEWRRVLLDPKSQQDKSQSYKFKEFAKNSNFRIFK